MAIIHDEDELLQWIVTKLTPMCDTDPLTLARCVLALIITAESEKDLVSTCTEVLKVFLGEGTDHFIHQLMQCSLGQSDLKTETVKQVNWGGHHCNSCDSDFLPFN